MASNKEGIYGEDVDASSDLPSDIVLTILVGLPVKSLLRFRTVSKWWNSIITHPHLAKMHENSWSHLIQFLVKMDYDGQYCLLKFEGQRFRIESLLRNPIGSSIILCYCKGIVLVLNSDPLGRALRVLWNPNTRTYARIPWPCDFHVTQDRYGLCYDSANDDYKVVVVHENSTYSVFSCKNGAWSERKEFLKNITCCHQGFYVDGACYWPCADESYERNNFMLLRIMHFNPRNDEFDVLELPCDVMRSDVKYHVKNGEKLHLTSFRGGLCLCHYTHGTNMIQLWMREKNIRGGCWKELLIIKDILIGHRLWLCPINDNIIAILGMSNNFVIYDTSEERVVGEVQDNEEKYILSRELQRFKTPQIIPCEESLFLPL